MVSASPERNFPNTEICLPFAQTDPNGKPTGVNGKQPKILCAFVTNVFLVYFV